MSRAWQNGYMKRKKRATVKSRKKKANERRKTTPKNKLPKQNRDDLFGFMAGKFEIVGDIVSPMPDWAHWRPAKNL